MNDESLISVFFLGDISLNDNYIELYKRGEKPFEKISDILNNSDLVVGNLECFSDSQEGENLLKKPRLKTKLETLNYLKDINLGLACLANNHFYDNLEEGFKKTIEFLSYNNINYIGASINGSEGQPFIFEKNGISIAILNYVSQDTNPNLPYDAKVRPNWFYLKKVEEDITKLKDKVDYIIVYPHWGGRMEDAKLPDRELIPIAHKIIDAGADIIIGHHTHTIQPYEIYKGRYIFYNIGNFCSSDLIIDDKISYLDRKRNLKGLIILVQFSNNSINIKPMNIINKNNKIIILPDSTRLINIHKYIFIYKFWGSYIFYEKTLYPIISYLFYQGENPITQIKNLSFNKILKHISLNKG